MKFNFKFSNLCGTAYKQGNLVFSPGASLLYSPVGNRVTQFDLVNHSTRTLRFEARKNIRCMALDPVSGQILVVIDVDGRAMVVNVATETVLHRINFKKKVKFINFSPCSQLLAVAAENRVQVWKFHVKRVTKDEDGQKLTLDFSMPLMLHKTFFGHKQKINHIQWLADSRFILTGCVGGISKLFCLDERIAPNFRTITLSGHKDQIKSSFFIPKLDFSTDLQLFKANRFNPLFWEIWTVSSAGIVYVYEWVSSEEALTDDENEMEDNSVESAEDQDKLSLSDGDDNRSETQASNSSSTDEDELLKESEWSLLKGSWELKTKHEKFKPGSSVTCCSIQEVDASKIILSESEEAFSYVKNANSLLVLGYNDGTFSLFELPSMNLIQELSLSKFKINTAIISRSGEWIALGCGDLGQVAVWEWKSETFVLRQQGHFYNLINDSAFSPNGNLIATAGDDGKLKVWSTRTGFCFVTFADHSGPISATCFGPQGNILISCSLDGTVRAFDLVRYRNFRTFTSPDANVQFTCCAIDPSGELVFAGTQSPSRIIVWRLKTGQVMDILNGHEGPISSLHCGAEYLISSSWDGSIRLWDVFGGNCEKILIGSDLLCARIRPDGRQVATCGINGHIYFISTDSGKEEYMIEGGRDIVGGRKTSDKRSVSIASSVHCFTSLSYTADGRCILAAGRSKFICLYHVKSQMLLKKFQMSCNRSLDGILDKLNSKNLLESGAKEENEVSDSDSELENYEEKFGWNMKGGDITRRTTMPEIRCKSIEFSPTNEHFIASSTEGLMIYSLDSSITFDPFDITEDITPQTIFRAAEKGEVVKSLLMSLTLGESEIIRRILDLLPEDEIRFAAISVKKLYLKLLMETIAEQLAKSNRLEFYLKIMRAVFTAHSETIRDNVAEFTPTVRRLQKIVLESQRNFTKLCSENNYRLNFLLQQTA